MRKRLLFIFISYIFLSVSAQNTDDLLLFSGADIPPSIYGEKTLLMTELIYSGKNWEISLLFHLIGGSQNENYKPLLESNPNYPILRVCLGMQELDVASGGSLYQDIPSLIYGQSTFESILRGDYDNIHKNYWYNINNENRCTYIHFHPSRISEHSLLKHISIPENPIVASVDRQSVNIIGKDFSNIFSN